MTLYLFGTGTYCTFLLFLKFKDQQCSKTDLTSWLVIAIASSLWMIVIPISLIEIISKSKAKLPPKPIEIVAQAETQLIETTVLN